ncbi:hypothetical protein JCM8097_007538 [Rhodosporidiobolus ruineniae]
MRVFSFAVALATFSALPAALGHVPSAGQSEEAGSGYPAALQAPPAPSAHDRRGADSYLPLPGAHSDLRARRPFGAVDLDDPRYVDEGERREREKEKRFAAGQQKRLLKRGVHRRRWEAREKRDGLIGDLVGAVVSDGESGSSSAAPTSAPPAEEGASTSTEAGGAQTFPTDALATAPSTTNSASGTAAAAPLSTSLVGASSAVDPSSSAAPPLSTPDSGSTQVAASASGVVSTGLLTAASSGGVNATAAALSGESSGSSTSSAGLALASSAAAGNTTDAAASATAMSDNKTNAHGQTVTVFSTAGAASAQETGSTVARGTAGVGDEVGGAGRTRVGGAVVAVVVGVVVLLS